jgi:phosphoribosyl 1,2-cyclic phosphodiesterase
VRFCSLGSGSSGNATLVEAHDGTRTVRVLVDCGLTLRELTRRLAERDCLPSQLDAVFVTHEHSDHIGCASALMRKHGVTVYMSEGSWRGFAREHAPPAALRFARDGETIDLGALHASPCSSRSPTAGTAWACSPTPAASPTALSPSCSDAPRCCWSATTTSRCWPPGPTPNS